MIAAAAVRSSSNMKGRVPEVDWFLRCSKNSRPIYNFITSNTRWWWWWWLVSRRRFGRRRGSFVGNTHATVWFQQNGATSHTARMGTEKLREMFPHRLISRFRDGNWPPRSPDFSAPDYFCGVIWRVSRVFETRPTTLDELKADIREVIHDVLQRVMDDFTKRLQECIAAEWRYLLHYTSNYFHATQFSPKMPGLSGPY
jgi:hypothetical protein